MTPSDLFAPTAPPSTALVFVLFLFFVFRIEDISEKEWLRDLASRAVGAVIGVVFRAVWEDKGVPAPRSSSGAREVVDASDTGL